MPHIFPRRFLRTRDILDPREFNDDIQPAQQLIAGNLDRTNFDANSLKTGLRPSPTSDTPEPEGPCVAAGAYFNVYTSNVESKLPLYISGSDYSTRYSDRNPPNFVKLDGSTFRRPAAEDNTDAKPFIIPNNGAWAAVENADLSAAEQITFSSGSTKVWITAYAQYIWQGFYEYKSPYISGTKRFAYNENVTTPDVGTGPENTWSGHHMANLALAEQRSLNRFYPSETWEALPTAETPNNIANLEVYDASFAWPLNEAESAQQERRRPNRQGYHHISQGFEPCMVQFALRVDGKIIEETITGKNLPFEETSHGIRVTDSPPVKTASQESMEMFKQLRAEFIGDTIHEFLDIDNDPLLDFVRTGQKSYHSTSTLKESSEAIPGQKIRSSRSVAYGPEVMPVRLGCVVSLEPGNHTIELVVRRLERKKGQFKTGDYVGVFSRRMLAFECPVQALRSENDSEGASRSGMRSLDNLSVPNFLTEDLITPERMNQGRETLAARVNQVSETYITSNSLSNKYLPSKVTFSATETISPSFSINKYTGLYESFVDETYCQAIFPGRIYEGTSSGKQNNILSDRDDGWSDYSGGAAATTDNVGWYQVRRTTGQELGIVDTTGDMKVEPGEKLILFMDLDVRNIVPIYSQEAEEMRSSIFSLTAEDTRENWNMWVQHLLAERYLDLFALFAIGYKQDGAWNIMTDHVPAMLNNFNWVNRKPTFNCYENDVPMSTLELGNEHWWDAEPGWEYREDMDWHRLLRKTHFFKITTDALFFSETTKDFTFECDGRGDRVFPSNLGVNVPIMQVIENNTDTTMNINEIGAFASTYVPDDWTRGIKPGTERDYLFEVAEMYLHYSRAHSAWASPVGGRKILDGVLVRWGEGRLTAIKVTK